MKIENYETFKAGISTDLYTFPYNSTSFDINPQKFLDSTDYPYTFTYFGMKAFWKNKSNFICTGHFDGASKQTDYRSLKSNSMDHNLKKFFFDDDKFRICVGANCKSTYTGQRTNMLDYIASFMSPFNILFSSTQKTGLEASVEENEGDTFTPIEQITGSVTATNVVTITDAAGNGFKFTASETGTFTYYLIYMTDLGNNNVYSSFAYAEIDGTRQTLQQVNTAKDIFLGIEPGDTIADTFSGGTITNITPTFKFRDGYVSD